DAQRLLDLDVEPVDRQAETRREPRCQHRADRQRVGRLWPQLRIAAFEAVVGIRALVDRPVERRRDAGAGAVGRGSRRTGAGAGRRAGGGATGPPATDCGVKRSTTVGARTAWLKLARRRTPRAGSHSPPAL